MNNKERNLIITLASAVLHFQPRVCSPERENAIAHIRKAIATLSSSETEELDARLAEIELKCWVDELVSTDQWETKIGGWLLPTDMEDPLPDDLTDAVIKALAATHCTSLSDYNRIHPFYVALRDLVKNKLQREDTYHSRVRCSFEITRHPATLPTDLLDQQTVDLYTKLYMINQSIVSKLKLYYGK